MEQIKKFLRDKGFALALAACLVAAAATGVWAARTIRSELQKNLDSLQSESAASTPNPGTDEGTNETEEAKQWQQQTTQAANSVNNVPKPETNGRSASSASSATRSAPSGAASGSGTVLEPSELRTDSAPASSSAAQASTRPVSGRMLNAYSADELVYNKTLGDWRTHNGTDYACEEGEAVLSPVAGTVVETGSNGNWGETVSIKDSKGYIWRLCGVTDQIVKQGDAVSAGQTLGKAGTISAECAEESHIHIEVKDGESYLDPAKLLG